MCMCVCLAVARSLWRNGLEPGGLHSRHPVQAQDGHGYGQEHDPRQHVRCADHHGLLDAPTLDRLHGGPHRENPVGGDGYKQQVRVGEKKHISLLLAWVEGTRKANIIGVQ